MKLKVRHCALMTICLITFYGCSPGKKEEGAFKCPENNNILIMKYDKKNELVKGITANGHYWDASFKATELGDNVIYTDTKRGQFSPTYTLDRKTMKHKTMTIDGDVETVQCEWVG